jgi:hypothetical protein
MYINMGANNGSEKLTKKNTATSVKLTNAEYASYVYVLYFLYKLVRSSRV